jgi:hypothetical protein
VLKTSKSVANVHFIINRKLGKYCGLLSQVGSFAVLDKEERKTNTASAPCLAAGKFVPSVQRFVVGL